MNEHWRDQLRDERGRWVRYIFTNTDTVVDANFASRIVEESSHVNARFKTTKEAASFVANSLGVCYDEAFAMVVSVNAWSTPICSDIRRYQTGKELQKISLEKAKYISDNIEKYISISPKWNGKTYRGISLSDDALSRYRDGIIVDMLGASSWSDRYDVSKKFAKDNISNENPNQVIFICDAQSKGTSIKHLSTRPEQNEILVSKEAKYIVKKIDKRGEETWIYLNEEK